MKNETPAEVHNIDPQSIVICPTCSRDMTLRDSLRASIADSREWLHNHPHASGDFPAVSNVKQMLLEGCDFASVVLDCVINDRVVPAYANFRCLLERAHHAILQTWAEGAKWEYQSVARQQEILDRKLGRASSPEDQEWIKQRLASIRHWNRQPDEDGKPMSMRKHPTYKFDPGEMYPRIREWYDLCSMYVHPTFWGDQNVGRSFLEGETEKLVREVHLRLCSTAFFGFIFVDAVQNTDTSAR